MRFGKLVAQPNRQQRVVDSLLHAILPGQSHTEAAVVDVGRVRIPAFRFVDLRARPRT
ncbi:hypothetical protein BH20VER1_BH20VER1_02360 [soil metagenome]